MPRAPAQTCSRVYDALNVLMAMDIISKEKKEIRWCGHPEGTRRQMEEDLRRSDALQSSLATKRNHLRGDATSQSLTFVQRLQQVWQRRQVSTAQLLIGVVVGGAVAAGGTLVAVMIVLSGLS